MASFAAFKAERARRRAADAAPKTWADYEAEARARQAGHGFTHPLLSVTDEELAQADLAIEVFANPDARRAQQDAFFARYGVRRGDDKRDGGAK